MKSLSGKFGSTRGWALLLTLFVGAGLFVAACGDEEVPTPTTPAPTPPPAPPPEPEPPAPEKPATPTGLQVASQTANSITWTWNAVDGAHGYVVQASTDETFDDTDQLALTVQPSFTATPLPPGTNVYVRVAAGVLTAATPSLDPKDYLLSDWTTHVTGMTDAATPAAPAAPANVRATDRGSNYIEWSWDAVSGAAGYHAQFSRTTDFSDPDADRPLLQRTSVRISNLPAETDGYLRVRAYTGSGTGEDTVFGVWSATDGSSTREPPPAVPLDAPTGLQSTGSNDDSISLDWDSVDDADYYEVEQRAEDGDWVDASCGGGDAEVDETSCEATGLAEVTEYDFRVRAFPSSSDAQRRESDWTTLNNISTTGTRPPPPPMTVSGGEDDLNIIWDSTANTITWRWDQVADRSRKYQIYYSEENYNSKANPCIGPSAGGWVDADAGGFATSLIATNAHAAVSEALEAGDVALLCVQTTWDDDRGVTQYGNHSFAWAATTPATPSLATTPYDDKDGDTKAIYWQGVAFDQGFQYELRLVSAPPDEQSDGTTDAASAPDQDACTAGKELSDEDSGNRETFTLNAYDVTGLADYTSYHLCYQARNEDGTSRSAWAISADGGVTLPSQPSTISGSPSSVDHDDGLEWSFAVPTNGHPQETTSYVIELFQETAEAADANPKITGRRSLTAKDCEATTAIRNAADDGDIYTAKAAVAATNVTRTRTHIRVVVPEGSVTDAGTGPAKRNYLCVQSTVTSARVSKWRLSGSVTQRKDPGS